MLLANEFGDFAERLGVDVYQVIDAANSQPFSHIHRPGIYVGGHCIPVYPRFYSSVDEAALLPPLAREVNDAGPERAVSRLETHLGSLDRGDSRCAWFYLSGWSERNGFFWSFPSSGIS